MNRANQASRMCTMYPSRDPRAGCGLSVRSPEVDSGQGATWGSSGRINELPVGGNRSRTLCKGLRAAEGSWAPGGFAKQCWPQRATGHSIQARKTTMGISVQLGFIIKAEVGKWLSPYPQGPQFRCLL